jgi:hypothetical protein
MSIEYIGGGSSGSSGSSGGEDITGWFGCCGLAAGTYVPLTPHGQDVTVDNGVTNHRTFKAPYLTGIGGGQVAASCAAVWQWKTQQMQAGWAEEFSFGGVTYPRQPYFPSYGVVARCQGTDDDPIEYWNGSGVLEDPTSSFAVEYVRDLEVNLTVGNFPFVGVDDSRVAASASSTQITCYIDTRYEGHAFILAALGVYPQGNAAYDVLRREVYRVHLPKPCPQSGTFELAHVGTSTIYENVRQNIYDSPGHFMTVDLPDCVLATESYAVSITI